MRANEFLIEKALKKADFYNTARVNVFIDKMTHGKPFEKEDGTTVVLMSDENLLKQLTAVAPSVTKQKTAPLPAVLLDVNGNQVRLTSLKKTAEFGGSEKEDLKIKPSHLPSLSGTGPASSTEFDNPEVVKDILANRSFLAGELGKRITKDPILNGAAGKTGKIVIDLAKQIMAGRTPVVKTTMSKEETTGIRDYAGEYLGILQFIYGHASFPESEAFYEHLGTNDLTTLRLHFPKSSTSGLADSIGIQGADGSVMYMSSKGGPTGAAPSLDSLKIDSSILRTRSPAKKDVLNFLTLARDDNTVTKNQPFLLLNYLYSLNPAVVKGYYPELARLLPFKDKEIEYFLSLNGNDDVVPAGKAAKLINLFWQKQEGSNFGLIYILVTQSIIDLINKENILPAFQSTMLEILGSNFIQIYARLDNNQFATNIKWPNKIRGKITLKTKSYAASPLRGKLGFSYS